MKVVVFTFSGEGAGIAYRLAKEGTDVLLATIDDEADIKTSIERKGKGEDPEDKRRRLSVMEGKVEKMDAWKAVSLLKKVPFALRKAFFLFFDMNHCWKVAEALKDEGFYGIFPTEEDRKMEVEREDTKKFVEKNYPGMNVPETTEFRKVEDALQYLEEDDEDIYVVKGFDEDAETFVPESEDPAIAKQELRDQLLDGKKDYEKSGFMLERKITGGIEMTPEVAWWDGNIVYASVDLELKKQHAGNLGKLTGCSADLVFPVPMDCPLMKLCIPPAVHKMAERRKGLFIWDAAVMFDPEDDKPYYLESCCNRPGWNSFFTQMALLPGGITGFFERIIVGKDPFKGGKPFAASLRLFNDNQDKELGDRTAEGVPIYLDPESEESFFPMYVKEGKENDLVSCGYGEELGVTVGAGEDIEEAVSALYAATDGVVFKKRVFRPMHDFLSEDYDGNILARYAYGQDKGWFGPTGVPKKKG